MPDHVEQQRNPAIAPESNPLPDPEHDPGTCLATQDDALELPDRSTVQSLERLLKGRAFRIRSLEARIDERDRLVRRLRERITERGLYATWLESEVSQRDHRIRTLLDELNEQTARLEQTVVELDAMRSSRALRYISLIKSFRHRGRAIVRNLIRASRRLQTGIGQNPGDLGRSSSPLDVRTDIPTMAAGEVPAPSPLETLQPPPDRNRILHFIPPRCDPYDVWRSNNAPSVNEAFEILRRLPRQPKFSVILSCQESDPQLQRKTLASLRSQVYTNVEVLLVGGPAWTEAILGPQVRRLPDDGDRVIAIQSAVDQATGDYLVILDRNHQLAATALVDLAQAVVEAAEPPDLIFADEDDVDPEGNHIDPVFRPGWSPELLLARHSIGRTFAVRRDAIIAIGGLRPALGHAWVFDLALRLSESSERITHLPRVLTSIPVDRRSDEAKSQDSPQSIALYGQALQEALDRRKIRARVTQTEWDRRQGEASFSLDFPDEGPKVAILIPTRDRVDLLHRCLDSILQKTTYRNYEIVVIDNESEDPESLAYFEQLETPYRVVRIANDGNRFSYAGIHNRAIRALDQSVEFVVLLNNDTEVRRPEWLSQLVGYGQMPGIGAVGARLLYADGRVQHAGMVTDLFNGVPGHLFKGVPWWQVGEQSLERVARNVGAVTAACMLVRRQTYIDLGGFDEQRFAVGYNDVDFCMRLRAIGLRCVFAPRAELLHLEGASRGVQDNLHEREAFRNAWQNHADPYRHPAFSRHEERPSLCTRFYGPGQRISDRPIRVLIAMDRLDGGSQAWFAWNLIDGYRRQGRIVPEVRARVDGSFGALLRDQGIPVTIPSDDDSPGTIDTVIAPTVLRDRNDYDLIHVIGMGMFETVLAASQAGVPSLWTIREAIDLRDAFAMLGDDQARRAIQAFAASYRVIFPAWGIRQYLQPAESRWNFEVIHESSRELGEMERKRNESRDARPWEPAILSYLLENDDQGGLSFLEQIENLVRSGRDIMAQVFGPPELLSKLSRTDPAQTLSGRLKCLPIPIESPGSLAQTDFLVNASTRDLPLNTIALGLRYQIPLILSNVDGIDEYLVADQSALMFDPDDPKQLQSRIEQLLDDPACGQSLVTPGHCRPFQEMIEAYERLILEAISVREAQPPVALTVQRGVA